MRVRKNAVSVLCPRYGLEGPVYLDGRQDTPAGAIHPASTPIHLTACSGRGEAQGDGGRHGDAGVRCRAAAAHRHRRGGHHGHVPRV